MSTNEAPKIRLNNGVEMPAFGLGVFKSEPEKTVEAVSSAIGSGYRLIDTAAAYRNELQVGQGVRAAGVVRSDIFVTTKLWMSDYGYDSTLRAFDLSLEKLGFDYLDLYLVHWPVPAEFEKTIASYKAMMALLSEGRVRAIGVSNFTFGHLEKLIAETGHVPAVNQIELHPFFAQPKLRRFHEERGIVTQAWSPIGGVNRYGAKAAQDALEDPLTHPTVVSLAKKYAKTPAQIILRWQIELGNSPIPKSVRPERIAENIEIFDFELTRDEVSSIAALDTGARGGWAPDQVTAETFK